jgi:serine/threonine protein kinase
LNPVNNRFFVRSPVRQIVIKSLARDHRYRHPNRARVGRALCQRHFHRDIKPANIIITKSGVVKILDFRLAKLAITAGSPKPGSTPGHVAYMSPGTDAWRRDRSARRSWALGVVLYRNGGWPTAVKGECDAAILYAIVNLPPEPYKNFTRIVPTQLAGVIERALQKESAGSLPDRGGVHTGSLQACWSSDAVTPSCAQKKNKHPGASKKRNILSESPRFLHFHACSFWRRVGHSAKKPPVCECRKKLFAIFPFKRAWRSCLQLSGRGMMDLLYTNLNSVGDLRSV